MSIKKYTGAAMALVMVASNAAQAVQVQAVEDKAEQYDNQVQNNQAASVDYSSNKDENFIEGVEPKVDDTDEVINVKDENMEDASDKEETSNSDEGLSDNNEVSENNDENLDNEENVESNEESAEEITEDADSQENISGENSEIQVNEIPATVHKGDGIEELQYVELSDEELSKIPVYTPENQLQSYNSSADQFNYSTTRGRDSLASLSNGAAIQAGYDAVLSYFSKIHNGEIDFKANLSSGTYYSNAVDLSSLNLTQDDAMKIFLTVRYDHPEMFWIGGSFTGTTTDGTHMATLTISVQSQFIDSNSIKAAKIKLDNAVSEYLAAAAGCSSDYDIEKTFHDKMIRDAVYDPYVNSPTYINVNSHNALGILVDKVGVCESYAKAMQLLLNAKGIDNLYVTGKGNGGGHAWNQVKINGVYCNLDATWDDLDSIENGGIQYNYFNVPDSDFTSSHVANGPACTAGTKEYMYATEKCTSSDYTWFNQNKENVFLAADVNDNDKKKAYIISQIRTSVENDDYNVQITGENYSTANSLLSYLQSNLSNLVNSDDLKDLFLIKFTGSIGWTGLNSGNRQFSIKLTPVSPVKAASITMPDKITITTLKNSKYLTPIVLPDNTSETIKWTSSNSSVAMIDSVSGKPVKGVIVPRSKGKAIVTATIGDVSAQCEVTVCDPVYTDKDVLQKLYDDNKDKSEDSYKADSWTAFKTAMDNAKVVLDNESASQSDVDNAVSALEDAVNKLVSNRDKTALQKLYDDNKDKVSSSYTSTSWTGFDTAMKAAKTVLDNDDAVQTEINKAKEDLESAVSKLVAVGDKAKLQKLYNDNKDKSAASYTSSTWTAFDTAMKAAKTVLDNDDAVQTEVDKAESDLESAIGKLMEAADKSELQKLYNDNKDRIEAAYTSTTWYAFASAMSNAKSVLDNADAVQSEVGKAKTDLETAISKLMKVGDKAELQKLYDDNKDKVSSSYTSTSWTVFDNAMKNAKGVLDNSSAVQDDVDKAELALESAVSKLVAVGDKAELQKLYDDNKDRSASSYTSTSWPAFDTAIKAAKTVLDNADAVQSEVNKAKTDLETAISKLVIVGDKTGLQKLYDDNKNKTEASYTSSTWTAFDTAMKAGKTVLDNGDAVQSQIDTAKRNLETAISKLVLVGDKTALQKLYDDNSSKVSTSYTSTTWTAFNTAMKNAKTVLDNRDALQSQVGQSNYRFRNIHKQACRIRG